MKITSFNILADTFIDFDNPQKYYPNIDKKLLQMRNRFDKLIKYIHGDIILLQEVTPWIRRRLYITFNEKYNILKLSEHKSKTESSGNLTLIKKNIFNKINHKTIYLNNNAFGVTTVDDDIDIYNIHLNDVSKKIRTKELKFIKSTFNKNKIIIGGDFNSDDSNLHNILNKFEFNIKKKSTYLCEKPMIDYIYSYGFDNSNGYIDNTITGKNCYTDTLKKYGSDHHPIYLNIS